VQLVFEVHVPHQAPQAEQLGVARKKFGAHPTHEVVLFATQQPVGLVPVMHEPLLANQAVVGHDVHAVDVAEHKTGTDATKTYPVNAVVQTVADVHAAQPAAHVKQPVAGVE